MENFLPALGQQPRGAQLGRKTEHRHHPVVSGAVRRRGETRASSDPSWAPRLLLGSKVHVFRPSPWSRVGRCSQSGRRALCVSV